MLEIGLDTTTDIAISRTAGIMHTTTRATHTERTSMAPAVAQLELDYCPTIATTLRVLVTLTAISAITTKRKSEL